MTDRLWVFLSVAAIGGVCITIGIYYAFIKDAQEYAEPNFLANIEVHSKMHFLEQNGLNHLSGNLVYVAYWDNVTRMWYVSDISGEFAPEMLPMPPDPKFSRPDEIGPLRKLIQGRLYVFHMRHDQIVNLREGESGDWVFHSGPNSVVWP